MAFIKNKLFKEFLNLFLITVILFFYSTFFIRTPFEDMFFKIRFILTLMFLLFIMFLIISKNIKIEGILLFFIYLMFFPLLYSTIRANIVFGQPLFYGILVERKWLTIAFSFFIYFILTKRIVDFRTIEKSFVIMAFFSLIVFIGLYIIAGNYPNFISFFKGGVKYTKLKGLRVRLDCYFLVFGAIYFFIKFYLKNSRKDLLIFTLFLLSIFMFYKGRMVFIILIITLCLFLFLFFGRTGFKKIVIFIFCVFLGINGLDLINQQFSKSLLSPYKAMIKSFSGKTIKDYSLNSRKKEFYKAINFLINNPNCSFWGSGRLSKNWKKGYERVFGRFFPLDIGLLGVLFVYGLLGSIIVFVIPFYFTVKIIFKIKDSEEINAFLLSLKYILLFILISSFYSSRMVFTPYTIVLPLFIILADFSIKRNKLNFKEFMKND